MQRQMTRREQIAYQQARRKRRRRKKIRRTVRLCLFLLFVLALIGLLIWGIAALVGRKNRKPAEAETHYTPTPPLVTAAPTAEPTPAPTSVPTFVPTIDAVWYTERNERIADYLRRYGGYTDEASVQAKLMTMQIDKEGKMVALTFDDGPDPAYTGAILDALEKYNARATFFVLGTAISGNEDLIGRALALGCEIGNHTMRHEDLEELSDRDMRNTVSGVNELMKEKFGYTVTLLRPPYISFGETGSQKREEFVDMLKDFGMLCVNHTRSSHDTYAEYTTRMIVERMLENKDELGYGIDGSIFLFHDKSQKTVDAVPKIIEGLQAEGYQLVTVSELLNCSEEGLHTGWIYRKAD